MKARSSFPWPAFGILGAFLLVAGNGLAAPPTAAIAYRLDEGADHARCGKECWPHFNGFIEKTLANMRQR